MAATGGMGYQRLREAVPSLLKDLERITPWFSIHIEDERPGFRTCCHPQLQSGNLLSQDERAFFIACGLIWPIRRREALFAGLHRE